MSRNEGNMYSRSVFQKEIIDRFWSYVDKTSTCWLWKKGCFQSGYGQFRVGNKKVRAHRFSYEIAFGAILPNVLVCHKCDIKRCVNPSHLFLSTQKGNVQDRVAKNRSGRLYGEKAPSVKLTQSEVNMIRGLARTGITHRELAKRFSVHYNHIGRIIRRERWNDPKQNEYV